VGSPSTEVVVAGDVVGLACRLAKDDSDVLISDKLLRFPVKKPSKWGVGWDTEAIGTTEDVTHGYDWAAIWESMGGCTI